MYITEQKFKKKKRKEKKKDTLWAVNAGQA